MENPFLSQKSIFVPLEWNSDFHTVWAQSLKNAIRWIDSFQILAKFGMMHIIATNSCLVIRTLVKESAKEMEHSSQLSDNHDDGGTQTHGSVDHLACCQRIHIIGETIENSSIYLYPFIIEYSIIGISVVYR